MTHPTLLHRMIRQGRQLLRYSWQRGEQVGSLRSGEPIYRWHDSETSQTRDQGVEPGTGKKGKADTSPAEPLQNRSRRQRSMDEARQLGPNPAIDDEGRPPLTPVEINACRGYTVTYESLNRSLREGKSLTGDAAAVDQGLRSAFAKCRPFQEPCEVNRGMYLEGPVLERFIGQCKQSMQQETPIVMPGYTSTTTWLPRDNGQPPFGGNISLEIKAWYGLDLKPHASPRNAFESELLIDRASEFRVTGIKKTPAGYSIQMEQLNRQPTVPRPVDKTYPVKSRKGLWSWLLGRKK